MLRRSLRKERILVRKLLVAVTVGIFFGTIFPAVFVGKKQFSRSAIVLCELDFSPASNISADPDL
jgi:hypothetical protein